MDLVLVPNVGTYVELHYIEHFSAKKCHNFEGVVSTLCITLVQYNTLKGSPCDSCKVRRIFSEKDRFFKKQRP